MTAVAKPFPDRRGLEPPHGFGFLVRLEARPEARAPANATDVQPPVDDEDFVSVHAGEAVHYGKPHLRWRCKTL